MARPMLGDLELEQVQLVETDEDQVVTRHPVPGLEGDFLQELGRRGARLRLAGVLTRPDTQQSLADLRSRFHAGDPVAFVSDISTATLVDDVLIEQMDVRELAGRPSTFEYDFALREFTEPERIETEEVILPPPPEPDVETGKLSVTVVVEGDPAFDMDRVRVTVRGTEEFTLAALDRTLAKRISSNVWFEEPFPAGDFTVEALVDDTKTVTGQREVLTGSAKVRVQNGPVTTVTIVLRRGAKVGTVFVITFTYDKAFVEPCMRHVLQQVAKHADQHRNDERLLVTGHTDLTGSDEYNQALSERRARATYAVLTFGHDPQKSVAEWDELRRARPTGEIKTVKDTWGTREIQHILQDLGHYKGNVGKFTGDDAVLTDTAIKQFQRDHGLADDGVVGDDTWPVLIEAYLGHDPVDIPAGQFLPNANQQGCDQGALRWIGCGEQDPVRNINTAWRPNRRTELMFVKESELPCQVPEPVTHALVPGGAGGGGWCLDDGTATAVDCFVVPIDPRPVGPPNPNQWLRKPAEPGSFAVTGTITFEDGTAFTGKYVLTAPDGEYMNGEVPTTSNVAHAGTPTAGKPDANGNFVHASTASTDKGPGTFSVEVDGPFLARTRTQSLADAKGNAVCFQLDGSAPADVVVVDRAVAAIQPSITGPDAVVVRKPHTNPARQPVVLRASTAFTGTGSFTRSSDRVKFFDAAAGGNEITFNGTDNVFTDAQLVAGHSLFAEGFSASAAVNDVTLTLALTVNGTPGLAATKTMTSVELTLDIAALPDPTGADRGDLSAAEKANPGRFLQLQTVDRQARRARLTIRPPQPAGFGSALVLRRLTAGVDMFLNEAVAAADVPIGAEHPIPAPVPAAGVRVFCQGSTVSTAPRDTGFQLGLAGGEADGDRVAITVATIEVIRADNTVFPLVGDDACHMVSKFVTNADLPDVATFDGPIPANADPDTFRVQVRGLPPGTAPVARVVVTRPGLTVYTQDFPTLQSAAGAVRDFRSNEHIRLVSNDVDDAHLAHQTAKVQLADDVAAVVLVGGNRLGSMTLPVGRPPAEAGPKAIRTCDVNFITLTGLVSNPAATVTRMSENWAQLAIRFSLVGQRTVVPVANVLSVDFPGLGGTAAAAGSLTVDITPAGAGAATRVIALVAAGDSDDVIAGKLAAAISARPGLAATHHRHDTEFLVVVNRGTAVTFANTATTVAGLVFQVPPLNFTDDITLLEGSVLGLNFADASQSTIDVVVVDNVPLLPPRNLIGATGGDFLLANLPGWHNLSIIQQRTADGSAGFTLVAGHEMGHALMDGGDAVHARAPFQLPTSPIATNLLQPVNTVDAIGAGKRLDAEQNTRARTSSGPATVPPLLQAR